MDDSVLLSVTGTTYGSVAVFVCDEGFVWRSGDNSSECGADGLWGGLSMVCEGNTLRGFLSDVYLCCDAL